MAASLPPPLTPSPYHAHPMSRIDHIFTTLREQGRTALMPFVTAGYPSLEVTEQALPAIEDAGASIVELGIPFSDPIADGPVIAASMHEALQGGTTPRAVFEMVRRLRPGTELGLIAMVSESIVMRIGQERFASEAVEAGFDGLIVPDLDTADSGALRALADEHDLSLSLLIAPNSSPQRVKEIASMCSGFVYLLARAGVTGESDAPPEIEEKVSLIRTVTDLPIAVGFGISCAEHVTAVTQVADAAIVGSALVRRMGEADDPVDAARRFVRELARGLSVKTATDAAP